MTDRIVNQFLCYLDGVEGRDGVFVMAATARPDLVDVALLRPGRIDKAVYCSFPDEQERYEMLKVYLKKFNFVTEYEIDQHEQFLKNVSQRTRNFTSADIKGLVQNTQLEKMSEIIKKSTEAKEESENLDFSISEIDIEKTL